MDAKRRNMDYWTGLYFLVFLNNAFSMPDTSYTVHDGEKLSFDRAQEFCEDEDSFLTNMASESETLKILKAIEAKRDISLTSFWIGLKKNKSSCVQPDLPLRGFSWIVDSSSTFVADKWKSEPPETCTFVFCGLLVVKYAGSRTDSWQLDYKKCTESYPFICKDKRQKEKKECPDPEIQGTRDIMKKHNDPYTLEVTCKDKDTFTLTCSPRTGNWMLENNTKANISTLCVECPKGSKKDVHGICVDVNDCEQVGMCKKAEHPPSFTPRPDGFLDKPTVSSFQTSSTTESNVHVEDRTGDLSNIIIPVIIALLIFVVLVVIIVGIVKYCLIRRSKKRAKKRAEAFKESVALNGSDSMDKVNEK